MFSGVTHQSDSTLLSPQRSSNSRVCGQHVEPRLKGNAATLHYVLLSTMVPTLQQPHSGGAVHSLKLTTCEDPVAKCKTSNETARTDKEKKKEAQRQAWFENTVKDELNIPTSYEEAAVTIIRWDAEIDAFRDGHDSEVSNSSPLQCLIYTSPMTSDPT